MSEVFKKLQKAALAAAYMDSYITVNAGREALIENVTHVYECNEIMSRVKTRDADVTVWGEALEMSSFREGVVKITGRINSVEITRRTGTKDD